MFNNPNIKKYITADLKPYTYENRFMYVKEATGIDTLIILLMFDRKSGKFIGNIDFNNTILNNVEIGIIINEDKHYG